MGHELQRVRSSTSKSSRKSSVKVDGEVPPAPLAPAELVVPPPGLPPDPVAIPPAPPVELAVPPVLEVLAVPPLPDELPPPWESLAPPVPFVEPPALRGLSTVLLQDHSEQATTTASGPISSHDMVAPWPYSTRAASHLLPRLHLAASDNVVRCGPARKPCFSPSPCWRGVEPKLGDTNRASVARAIFHEEPELDFVFRGAATLGVGDQCVTVTAGDVVLLHPGQDHELLEASADLELHVVALQPSLVERLRGFAVCPASARVRLEASQQRALEERLTAVAGVERRDGGGTRARGRFLDGSGRFHRRARAESQGAAKSYEWNEPGRRNGSRIDWERTRVS